MAAFGIPFFLAYDCLQTVVGGELGQLALVEEESLSRSRMSFQISDRRLNENENTVGSKLGGELHKQRTVEIVKAQDHIPGAVWELVGFKICALGGKLDVF